MRGTFEEYKERVQEEIMSCVERLQCQPILFAGAGISIRYFGGPSWKQLLKHLADSGAINRDFEYHIQDKEHNMPKIGTEFAEAYKSWAWDNQSDFPPWIFTGDAPKDIYIKYRIADYFRDKTPDDLNNIDSRYDGEIEALQKLQPHAVITTNYDQFLELVFQEYKPIIGETLISEPYSYIGEIYKIHGCTSSPTEMVLTEEDYSKFIDERKYLSAKLLTYFTEHPLLIVGYEPDDENVKQILSDVNRVLDNNQPSNIFLVDYDQNIPESGAFEQERLIDVGGGEQMIVNYIRASDFEWIYDSFAQGGEISGVNMKLLRRLMKNTYEIVTEDAPKREINFERLKVASEEKDRLSTLFGIAPLEGGAMDFSDQGMSVSLDDDGIPVEGIVTDDPVDDINDKLATAVSSWRSNGSVITERQPLYTFYRRRSELDLDNRRAEFLLRSSLKNNFHGSVWIEQFDGDISRLINDVWDLINGLNLNAYERILLSLKQNEMLEGIASDDSIDFISSKSEDYMAICENNPLYRIKEYTGDNVRFNDDSYDVKKLFNNPDDLDELIDDVIGELSNNDNTTNRRALKELEMIQLVNYSENSSIEV